MLQRQAMRGHLHLDEQNVLASSGPCHVQMGQRMRMRQGSEQGMVGLERYAEGFTKAGGAQGAALWQ